MKKIILLTACLLAVCVLIGTQASRAARAEHQLTEVYQAALDEMLEELDEMELALEKLLISADSAQSAALLSRISQAGAGVTRSLAVLPVDHHALAETMSFVSRVSGYADALLPTLAQGGISESDRAQLHDELTACARLCSEMLLARQAIACNASSFALEEAAVVYPALNYRGRYGTAVRAPVQRNEKTLSGEEAASLAHLFFAPQQAEAVYQRTSSGTLAAHEVSVQLSDLTLDLALTVQGGHLLWMTPRAAVFAPLLSEDACAEAAAAFLALQDFGAMTLVWQEQYDGLSVCTFAAEQENTTLYADLVHVQVRMDTGSVVGLEASQYWLYHTPRTLPQPVLSAAQAASLVSPEVTISDHRLCLLPLYGEELLCYEFRVSRGDGRYLIFLDAATGREALIQKLVTTPSGTRPA